MSAALSAYLALSRLIPLAAPLVLARRRAAGKEDPARWREKLGHASAQRPPGRLIWLHAVGLGEVLALRGLIAALAEQDAGLSFLVTSGTRASGQVFGANLPPRTQHQFLPLDAPRYLARFLAHWRPDLSIWAEQDLWPGAVAATHAAGVPLALVNARMNEAAHARRARGRGLYAALLSRFALIAAQDPVTARHLADLGAPDPRVTGALKAAAPPLTCDAAVLATFRHALTGRDPWLVAPSHAQDEDIALSVQAADTARLLILAPRDPARAPQIAARAAALGLPATRKSLGEGPGAAPVHIVDAYGDLGLWYRLCRHALIGGSFGPTQGHNPWEAAALGAAILHGPQVANFAADYAALDGAGAAMPVTAQTLSAVLAADPAPLAARATALHRAAAGSLAPLARDLLALIR